MQQDVWSRGRYRRSPLDANLRRADSILYALSEPVYHGYEAQAHRRARSARTRGQPFESMGSRVKSLVA